MRINFFYHLFQSVTKVTNIVAYFKLHFCLITNIPTQIVSTEINFEGAQKESFFTFHMHFIWVQFIWELIFASWGKLITLNDHKQTFSYTKNILTRFLFNRQHIYTEIYLVQFRFFMRALWCYCLHFWNISFFLCSSNYHP